MPSAWCASLKAFQSHPDMSVQSLSPPGKGQYMPRNSSFFIKWHAICAFSLSSRMLAAQMQRLVSNEDSEPSSGVVQQCSWKASPLMMRCEIGS
eukprot:scaffold13333_cov32-Tisochrysis_lutea.AAC.5